MHHSCSPRRLASIAAAAMLVAPMLLLARHGPARADVFAPAAGHIAFVPASPLTMTVNTVVNVAVSEPRYHGPFKVTACAGPNCLRVKYGWACYTRSTPDDINSITAQFKLAQTMILTEYAAGQYYPSVACTFTVKDSLGHSATYTAQAAAKF